MEENAFMEQIRLCESNHRVINIEKLILKTLGYDRLQQLETRVIELKSTRKQKEIFDQLDSYIDMICGKFVEEGKHCLTCGKTYCQECFDEEKHQNHELTEDNLSGICWCGNKLEGYDSCHSHDYHYLSSSSQPKETKEMKVIIQSKEKEEREKQINQSIQNIYESCVEILRNHQDHRETSIVLFRAILKFIQNKEIKRIVNQHLKDEQIEVLCMIYNDMNRQREEYPFFKYYHCIIELLLFDSSKYELNMSIANKRLLPLHLFHLFSSPQYHIDFSSFLSLQHSNEKENQKEKEEERKEIQKKYEMIIQTLNYQLNIQMNELIFKNQLKLCVRRLQSLFFNNMNLLTQIYPFVDNNLLVSLLDFLVNMNDLLIREIPTEQKNITDSVIFQYIKTYIKVFWKMIEELTDQGPSKIMR